VGIEIPFPHMTVYFGENRQGTAPPANVMLTRASGGSAPS
jgi:small conductance mechanosensitive channel